MKLDTRKVATVQEALRQADRLLTDCGIEGAQRDSRLLLSKILNRDLAWILTHHEAEITDSDRNSFLDWVHQRASGKPLAYITGRKEFFGREFLVSPAVLIPRPETELLIEHGIAIFSQGSSRPSGRFFLADIGTGSGCVAVSLAAEIRSVRLVATDVSDSALNVARRNAADHGVSDRIEFVNADLLPASVKDLDAIFSNPPYVCESDTLLAAEVHLNEPALALFADQKGLGFYSRIVPLAEERLKRGGWLVLELGYGAAEKVTRFLGSGWRKVSVVPDLQGIPRCLVACWRP